MCLFVWLGTEKPLEPFELASRQSPRPDSGYHEIVPVAPASPVHARFTVPYVVSFGSHEGCGCGYNSDTFLYDGFDSPTEVLALGEALSSDERNELLAEQASRARLRDAVIAALVDGKVEVYGCWAGDEANEPIAVEDVTPGHFTDHLAPIREGVLYRVKDSTHLAKP